MTHQVGEEEDGALQHPDHEQVAALVVPADLAAELGDAALQVLLGDEGFFIGLVADRYFATEKVMAVLYAIGAVLMYLVTRATTFPQVYCLMLAFCLCYFPTVALTNSIGFQLVKDPGREFPVIRLMGTFGWIFINNIIGL